MKNVLVVRPDWGDLACRWGAEQLKRKTLKYMENANWQIIDLYADDANRRNILAELANVNYASLLGHGNETVYTANRLEKALWINDEGTLRVCEEGSELALNFLSCLVGKRLLPWMVKNGLRGAFGYTEEFIFLIDYNNFPNDIAEPYFNSHTSVDYQIAQGRSLKEAHEYRLETWRKYIETADPETKRYLIHNYNCDELFGDREFKPIEAKGWRKITFAGEVEVKGWILTKKYKFRGTAKIKEI